MSYRKRTCIRLEFFLQFFLHVNSCFTANSEDIVQKVFQKGRKAREVSHATWTVWCLYADGMGEAIGVTGRTRNSLRDALNDYAPTLEKNEGTYRLHSQRVHDGLIIDNGRVWLPALDCSGGV